MREAPHSCFHSADVYKTNVMQQQTHQIRICSVNPEGETLDDNSIK
jgi:hypothetical protein